MANLNITYEAMESEASNLKAGKQEIEEKLNQLANRINDLVSSGFVTDSASGAFQEMYQQYTSSAQNTIGSLENIASSLSQMANTMRQTDEELGRSIRG